MADGHRGAAGEIKKARRSVRPDEMHALLSEAGFERRFGKGDHWVYTPRRRFPLTIDPRKPHLPPTYVSRAVSAIEEVLDDEPGDEDGDDGR